MGLVGRILALEGRAAVEQDEQVEEGEEQEQNTPPVTVVVSVGMAGPPACSRGVAVDTGGAGIWEGSSGWL